MLNKKEERALKKYGADACRKAYGYWLVGHSPAAILRCCDCGFEFKTTAQVKAAIDVGRAMEISAMANAAPQRNL